MESKRDWETVMGLLNNWYGSAGGDSLAIATRYPKGDGVMAI
jgi:hypothetical protein